MAIRWQSGGNQVGIRWGSGCNQMAIRWESGGNQVGIRRQSGGNQTDCRSRDLEAMSSMWQSGGNQVAIRWQSAGNHPDRLQVARLGGDVEHVEREEEGRVDDAGQRAAEGAAEEAELQVGDEEPAREHHVLESEEERLGGVREHLCHMSRCAPPDEE
eukprot:6564019-Prymnesium_polylepis.1